MFIRAPTLIAAVLSLKPSASRVISVIPHILLSRRSPLWWELLTA